MKKALLEIYHRLYKAYGPQNWWPGETRFEVIVGAILTQQVSWKNVERAIDALKAEGLMDPIRLLQAPVEKIASLIRPTIYYNQKARKLKAFLEFFENRYRGDLDALFALSTPRLREELLSIRGIGEETADSIVLYAAEKPSFVVDAYTRRILARLGLIGGKESYGKIQELFTENLPQDVELYNEYHALLVRHGKERCRKRTPRCPGCPLGDLCQAADRNTAAADGERR